MEWIKDKVEPELQAEFEQFVRTGDASPEFLEKLATNEHLQEAADRAFAEGVQALTSLASAPAERVAQAASELAGLSAPEREKELARLDAMVAKQGPEVRQVIADIATLAR
jgi:uncharacterized protein YunC (DUF1805 family)